MYPKHDGDLPQDDKYFLILVRYVERNAKRANIVDRAEQWQWSSVWRREKSSDEQKKILEPPFGGPKFNSRIDIGRWERIENKEENAWTALISAVQKVGKVDECFIVVRHRGSIPQYYFKEIFSLACQRSVSEVPHRGIEPLFIG